MPFVSSREMLFKAQAGGYAVGAFNAENLEMAQAIIAAAEAEKLGYESRVLTDRMDCEVVLTQLSFI